MKFSVLTLFPEALAPYFESSIIGRAVKASDIEIELVQIRDFSTDKHKKVDDAPFGGGAGMVMAVQPLRDALFSVLKTNADPGQAGEEQGLLPASQGFKEDTRIILTSPRGALLTQEKCEELSRLRHLVIVCGHYEGVDQRFIDRYVDEEISIGDYVLTGGELAAAVIVDSVARLRDNVLAGESLDFESHQSGLLEYPHYTRPEIIDGDAVPEVLLSGHHANIEAWRLEEAERLTKKRRPDMYRRYKKRAADGSQGGGRKKK